MACQLHDREERGLSQLGGKVVCPSRKKSEALREARQVAGAATSRPTPTGLAGPQQPKLLDLSLGRMRIRCLGLHTEYSTLSGSEQQKCIPSHFWRPEAHGRGVSRATLPAETHGGLSPRLLLALGAAVNSWRSPSGSRTAPISAAAVTWPSSLISSLHGSQGHQSHCIKSPPDSSMTLS